VRALLFGELEKDISMKKYFNYFSSIRKMTNFIACALIVASAVVAIIPLFFVFYFVLLNGLSALSFDFIMNLPLPVGEPGGGVANAIVGSLKMVGTATVFVIPFGILAALFLTEYPAGRLSVILQFVIDLLSTIPSIVAGLFVYGVVVLTMGGFSGWAGVCALALLMFPVMVKTSEAVLKLTPQTVREAGLALGLARWRVILFIVVKGSAPALMTAILLSVARVAGETAPLLLTAFGNKFWTNSLSEPTASLPVQIYSYAISPFDDWHRQAWAGACLLLLIVFAINIFSRFVLWKTTNGRR
jgi:phosphate transport system permease protein